MKTTLDKAYEAEDGKEKALVIRVDKEHILNLLSLIKTAADVIEFFLNKNSCVIDLKFATFRQLKQMVNELDELLKPFETDDCNTRS